MPSTSPHTRLRQARENAGYPTAKAFATKIGIPQPTYALHETGKRALLPEVAKVYAEALQCSPAWLLTGEGEPSLGRENPGFYRVQEMDVRAVAGGGGTPLRLDGLTDDTQTWSVPADFMRAQTTAPSERLKIIRVYGDSMAPIFAPGDRVLVDLSDTTPTPPGIFVLWDGIGIVIKRIEFLPYSNPQTVRLTSANAAYGTYEKPLEDIHINGRVIAKWLWT